MDYKRNNKYMADIFDLERHCQDRLAGSEDAYMSPYAAYYWSNLNILSELELTHRGGAAGGYYSKVTKLAHSSPKTYFFESPQREPSSVVVTVRGTRNLRDAATDALVVYVSRSAFLTAVERQLDKYSPANDVAARVVRTVVEKSALLIADGKVRVHQGVFVSSIKCFGGVLNELVQGKYVKVRRNTDALELARHGPKLSQTRIRLYGHSLGAACASFIFIWLRQALRLPNNSQAVTCACMSCPMIADDPAYRLMFADHTQSDSVFRHYYTDGDPIVETLPRKAGLTRHASNTVFVCPMWPVKCEHTRRLMAHVIYQPERFVRIADTRRSPGKEEEEEKSISSFHDVCGKNNIRMSHNAKQFFERLRKAESNKFMNVGSRGKCTVALLASRRYLRFLKPGWV